MTSIIELWEFIELGEMLSTTRVIGAIVSLMLYVINYAIIINFVFYCLNIIEVEAG